MSDETDELNRYRNDFEEKVDGCLLIAVLLALVPPLGLFVAFGMAAEHLYATHCVRKDRKKAEQERAAAQAEAAAELDRQRKHELALAKASRPIVSPPPPPPPTPEEIAVAATARYQARLRIIDASPMDETEKKAARDEAKRKYLRDIGDML